MIETFGRSWCSSGARGFFGEGYWYSRKRLDKTTLVSKTVTWEPKVGNMLLRSDMQPKQYIPDCIKINFHEGSVLNAVGLSNPGAEVLFETGIWQRRRQPTILSFMAINVGRSERMQELQSYINLLYKLLPDFIAPVALQINFSCPNVDIHVLEDIQDSIEIARKLNIPLIPKINCLMPPTAIKHIKHIDALCISNTIPYGKFPELIPWAHLFGEISPLAHLGGGGLSGKYVIQPILNWLSTTELPFPIVTTTGQSIEHIKMMLEYNAVFFEFGTVNLLRPWRVKSMLRYLEI